MENKIFKDFLGIKKINNDIKLAMFSSSNRNIIYTGKFYYPIIVTKIDNHIIISCANEFTNKLKKEIIELKKINKNSLKDFLNKFAKREFRTFEIKEMYRLIKLSNKNSIDCSSVELINESKKNYFFNIVKKSNELKYKEKKWCEFTKIKAPLRN